MVEQILIKCSRQSGRRNSLSAFLFFKPIGEPKTAVIKGLMKLIESPNVVYWRT